MLVTSILKAKGRDIYSVGPDLSVLAVTRLLREKRIGAVLVCDEAGALLGVFSERDIVRALANDGVGILDKEVRTLMTREVVACEPTDSVEWVMTLMTERRVRHIPVLENGALVGLVSIGDVVKSRIAETEMEAEALKNYIATG